MLQVSLEKLDKMVSLVQAVVLVEVFKLLQRILSVTVYLIWVVEMAQLEAAAEDLEVDS